MLSVLESFTFYLTLTVISTITSTALLFKYSSPTLDSKVITLVCTWVGWCTSFSILALVPIDVATTLAFKSIPKQTFEIIQSLWDVSYWSTQVLTWLLIPVLQHVTASGERTVMKKLGYAIAKLWKFYVIVGGLAILGVCTAVAFGKLSVSTLPTLIVLLSNTYGLVAILLLLGYGLVHVPKSMYRSSFEDESQLHLIYYRVGRSFTRFEASAEALHRVLEVMLFTQQQVPTSETMVKGAIDACVKYARRVLNPLGYDLDGLRPARGGHIDVSVVDGLSEQDLDYAGDEAGVAALRARLKRCVAECVGSRGEYIGHVEDAIKLRSREGNQVLAAFGRWSLRVASGLAAVLSAAIVWCEATIAFGKHPDLSPFSIMIRSRRLEKYFWLLQGLVAAPLAYVSYCTFFSLFKLGSSFSSLNSYHMVPKATHSWSLLLNASLLSRFAAPLAFNYLHVIRMTGHQRGGHAMVFTSGIYGLQDVPLLGARFNTWFPLLLVVYVGILMTGICERCLSRFGGDPLNLGGLIAREDDEQDAMDTSNMYLRVGEGRVTKESDMSSGMMGADVMCSLGSQKGERHRTGSRIPV